MAWVDVMVGAIIGLLIALLFSRLFISHPKTMVVIVITFAIIGLAISDDFLTPNDKRWNIVFMFSKLFDQK